MATAGSFLSEDQFLCSICLDVFTEPVSIPCGHNFCQACLTLHWDGKKKCKCPLCNEKFNQGLKLCVNTTFRDVVESFKKHQAAADAYSPIEPGQVPCDCCLDNKMRAYKTCLVCLASFCKLHLEPHQKIPAFEGHKLVNPVDNLQDKICKEHSRILELFCQSDPTHVCVLCTERGDHDLVPVEEEHVDKGAQMRTSPAVEEIQEIGERKTRARAQHKRKGKSGQRANKMQPVQEHIHFFPGEGEWSDSVYMPENRGASFGRWYYEVCTEGKTCWDIGIVRESARWDRKSSHINGKWIIRFGYCNSRALHTIPVLGRKPETLIVFVDYEKGVVSFYDAGIAVPLHIFTGCEFRERVFLFFRPSHSSHIRCARKLLRPVEKPQYCEGECLLRGILLMLMWMIYRAAMKEIG